MARMSVRLTALKVRHLMRKPGTYADGDGLYLQVRAGGASWLYRYMLEGRSREMGLGSLALVSLQEARAKAHEARKLRQEGIDPIDARNTQRLALQLEAAKRVNFKQCAESYVQAHRAGWRNAKHCQQWQSTLSTYAEPFIGELPVQAIDTALVKKVLEQDARDRFTGKTAPLWLAKPETASRLRGRIEAILDWATVLGHRSGDNPARWRGHLAMLLPPHGVTRRVKHHAALAVDDLPHFIESLRREKGIAPRALEFAILTAARTGEVQGARWREINYAHRLWIVPAERMKTGEEHRVPLGPRAMAVLTEMKLLFRNEGPPLGEYFIFPNHRSRGPMSNMALLMLLRRMQRGDLTVHGFRSTF